MAEFTQLGDYLNLPVRVYSTGMLTRLAFAVVTSLQTDILVMDELIGTGDAEFMERAQRRLTEFMGSSKALFLASHDEMVLQRFCDKCIYLKGGQLQAFGDTQEVLYLYKQDR